MNFQRTCFSFSFPSIRGCPSWFTTRRPHRQNDKKEWKTDKYISAFLCFLLLTINELIWQFCRYDAFTNWWEGLTSQAWIQPLNITSHASWLRAHKTISYIDPPNRIYYIWLANFYFSIFWNILFPPSLLLLSLSINHFRYRKYSKLHLIAQLVNIMTNSTDLPQRTPTCVFLNPKLKVDPEDRQLQ